MCFFRSLCFKTVSGSETSKTSPSKKPWSTRKINLRWHVQIRKEWNQCISPTTLPPKRDFVFSYGSLPTQQKYGIPSGDLPFQPWSQLSLHDAFVTEVGGIQFQGEEFLRNRWVWVLGWLRWLVAFLGDSFFGKFPMKKNGVPKFGWKFLRCFFV